MAPKNASETQHPRKYALNWLFVKRLWRCLKMIFPHWLSMTFLLFITLVGLTIAEQMLVYTTGLIPSHFYEVIGSKDRPGFKALVIKAISLLIVTAVVKTAVQFVANTSFVQYRLVMSRFIHSIYFKDSSHYDILILDPKKTIDNPDQRIAQDVDSMLFQLRKVFSNLLIMPLTASYYTYQCYVLTGYSAPLIMLGYFIVWAVFNKVLMSPVINTVYKVEKCGGDFRFKHMHVRMNSEALAFYGSDEVEERKTNEKLKAVVDQSQRVANLSVFIDLSVNSFNNISTIVCYIFIGITVFKGKYDDLSPTELGSEISQIAFVLTYLMKCFTNLIDLSDTLAEMAGYTHRIGELVENLEHSQKDKKKNCHAELIRDDELRKMMDFDTFFKLINVTYSIPGTDEALVTDLNLVITKGKSIIITGKTGTGKSSLLRIIRGLWKPSSGYVVRNIDFEPHKVLFLPQHPILTNGTLKEQVIYPIDLNKFEESSSEGYLCDSRIVDLLSEVGLASVCRRVGGINGLVEGSWEDMLSPGEMQRLAFARLFYHEPDLAMMDEATSALDIATEKTLYGMCVDKGITMISIAHRETLDEYHDVHLRLLGDGKWVIGNGKLIKQASGY